MASKKLKTRKVGYIYLSLRKDEPRGYILDIERIDPFGGKPFRQDYWFEEKSAAEWWFRTINGNEDIISLHHETDLDPIKQYDLPGSVLW